MSSPKLSDLLLSYYLEDSQDSDSNSDGLEDLLGIFSGLNGYYYSGNDFYPPDDPHPALVDSAKRGDIASVKKLISQAESKAKDKSDKTFTQFVNDSRERKEVQEKYGYDKTWDWYDDTALIASARLGHVEIVKLLLLTGVCDPTLESCPVDDVYENAHEAVTKAKRPYSSRNITFSGNSKEVVIEMLEIANKYWEPASYQGASAGNRKVFSNKIKCKNEAEFDDFTKEITKAASKFKQIKDTIKDSQGPSCSQVSNNNDQLKSNTKDDVRFSTKYENLDSTILKSLLMDRDQEILELKIEVKQKEDINTELINVAVDTEKERLLERIFDEVKCTICTEIFIEPTSLNCGHIYCKFCLNAWRKQCDNDGAMELNCPTCREHIQTEDHNLSMENLIDAMVGEATIKMKDERRDLIEQRKEKKAFKTGYLKSWDISRGFGFISQDNGDDDLFVHYTGIKHYDERKYTDFLLAQIVNYEIEELGRPRAKNVTGPNGASLTEI